MRQAIRGIYRPPPAPRPVDGEAARRLAALGYVAASGALAQGPLPDPRGRRGQLAMLDAAMAAVEAQRWPAAAGLLERVLAAEPRMVDVHILLASVDEHLGRKAEAAAGYERAVAVSGNAPVVALIAARELLKLGRVEEARALAALGRGADAAASSELAVDLALVRGDLDAALAELRRAGGGQAAPALRRGVGMALAEAGRAREALELLAPLAGRSGGRGGSSGGGGAGGSDGRVAGGSGGGGAGNSLGGVDAGVLDALALALTDSGRGREAVGVLDRVLAAAPRDARARQILGTVALQEGHAAEARRQLELAVEIDPHLAVAWNTLGVARLQLDGPAAALAAWRKAVEVEPDYWEALFNLGLASAEAGSKGEARQALERFVAKAPPRLFAADLEQARQLLHKLGG